MTALLALALLAAVPLPPAPECHTQGMKILGERLAVSCVDKRAKRFLSELHGMAKPAYRVRGNY